MIITTEVVARGVAAFVLWNFIGLGLALYIVLWRSGN